MKKIILFFFPLLLLKPDLYCQEFYFPQDSASWKFVFRSDPWTLPSFHTFNMFGDTTINDQLYKKITYSNCWGATSGSLGYDYIRSESDQVFFLQKDSTDEFLLYDFGLEVGDSFPVSKECLGDFGDTIFVQWVDSILINENQKRKRLLFDNAEWVEGIGVINHLLTVSTGLVSLDYSVELMCFSVDGEYIINNTHYFNPDPEFSSGITFGCDGIIDQLDELEKNEILRVYPNPFSSEFNIKCSEFNDINRIDLFDAFGIFIRRLPNQIKQNLPELPTGIYFLRINKGGKHYFRRVVKV